MFNCSHYNKASRSLRNKIKVGDKVKFIIPFLTFSKLIKSVHRGKHYQLHTNAEATVSATVVKNDKDGLLIEITDYSQEFWKWLEREKSFEDGVTCYKDVFKASIHLGSITTFRYMTWCWRFDKEK